MPERTPLRMIPDPSRELPVVPEVDVLIVGGQLRRQGALLDEDEFGR